MAELIEHHSARTLKIRFTVELQAPPGALHDRLRQRQAALYEAVNRYADRFAATELGECVCGRRLGGLMGTFTYDIVHGEGHCTACGHPARANHYIYLDDAESTAFSWVEPLSYHPDFVTEVPCLSLSAQNGRSTR